MTERLDDVLTCWVSCSRAAVQGSTSVSDWVSKPEETRLSFIYISAGPAQRNTALFKPYATDPIMITTIWEQSKTFLITIYWIYRFIKEQILVVLLLLVQQKTCTLQHCYLTLFHMKHKKTMYCRIYVCVLSLMDDLPQASPPGGAFSF